METNQPQIKHYLDWSGLNRNKIIQTIFYIISIVIGFTLFFFSPILGGALFKNIIPDAEKDPSIYIHLSFGISLLVIFLLTKIFFNRPFYSIMLPKPKMNWKEFLIGIGIIWILSFIGLIIFYFEGKVTYKGWNLEYSAGFGFFAITIIGYLLQTLFEEVYFRGLIAQASYHVIKFAPFVILLQALFFAQLHIGNIEAWGNSYISGIPYFITAVTWGWVAWRTGSLAMSWGLHFGNNIFIVLFAKIKGDVTSTTPPFEIASSILSDSIIQSIMKLIITIIFIEIIFKKRNSERNVWTLKPKKS